MKKAHKIRLNPTPEQEQYLRQVAGVARFVYNWGLARWNETREVGGKPSIYSLKKEFNAIRGEKYPWSYNVTKCAVDTGFRNLKAAFDNFFRDCKKLQRGEIGKRHFRYPHFKSKKQSKPSFRLDRARFKLDGHWLKIQKLDTWINVTEEFRFEGEPITATISEYAGHWYVSITTGVEPPEHEHEKELVGIDLGIKTLAVLSDGQKYENQALLRSELRKLERLNRELSRREQGSGRWWRTKRKLQRFHARIRQRRQDYLHKMTTEIAKTYRLVGVEDLNVAGMLKSHRLALSIADAGFGEIYRQLNYKTDWYGGLLVSVDRFFPSSKTCSVCGCINKDLTLADREWTCACGTVHDRDENASKNIEVEALRMVAVVGSSRPKTHVERAQDLAGGGSR